MLGKFNRHKDSITMLLVCGAMCLFLYLYLSILQAKTNIKQNYVENVSYNVQKELTDAERMGECYRASVCRLLAEVGYYEARGEKSDQAVAGVMFVALNRRDNPRNWGNSLEKVVYAPWQFSYTHDGSLKRGIREHKAYERMLKIAHYVWSGEVEDPTKGADHYHTYRVNPIWRHKLEPTVKLGSHVYYRS